MDKDNIEKTIINSCSALYSNGRHLIEEKANERDIVTYILPFLREYFSNYGYQVDTEYNREGEIGNRDTKKDNNGGILLPDIVVHQHGPNGDNLVAVEVKGYWNKEPRELDEDLLRRLQAKHGYRFLYRLEIGENEPQLREVH